jgi:hypothetical protein
MMSSSDKFREYFKDTYSTQFMIEETRRVIQKKKDQFLAECMKLSDENLLAKLEQLKSNKRRLRLGLRRLRLRLGRLRLQRRRASRPLVTLELAPRARALDELPRQPLRVRGLWRAGLIFCPNRYLSIYATT